MTIKKIVKIDIIGYSNISYFINQKIINKKIFYIEDKSIETESGYIESIYLCKDKEGNVLVSIEKCPTVVTYEYIEVDDEISEKVIKNDDISERVKKIVEKNGKTPEERKENMLNITDEIHNFYNDYK